MKGVKRSFCEKLVKNAFLRLFYPSSIRKKNPSKIVTIDFMDHIVQKWDFIDLALKIETVVKIIAKFLKRDLAIEQESKRVHIQTKLANRIPTGIMISVIIGIFLENLAGHFSNRLFFRYFLFRELRQMTRDITASITARI